MTDWPSIAAADLSKDVQGLEDFSGGFKITAAMECRLRQLGWLARTPNNFSDVTEAGRRVLANAKGEEPALTIDEREWHLFCPECEQTVVGGPNCETCGAETFTVVPQSALDDLKAGYLALRAILIRNHPELEEGRPG